MDFGSLDYVSAKERLTKLDSNKQLVFGALCCERLLPNYKAFQLETGWGNYCTIRNALDFVWETLNSDTINPTEVKSVLESCEALTPDSDSFTSIYVTSAQDACFAVCSLLDFISADNVDRIVDVATLAIESVDLFVQETKCMDPYDPDLEQKILCHRLMQRELAQQDRELSAVEQIVSNDIQNLLNLKGLWENDGKSNLDLP